MTDNYKNISKLSVGNASHKTHLIINNMFQENWSEPADIEEFKNFEPKNTKVGISTTEARAFRKNRYLASKAERRFNLMQFPKNRNKQVTPGTVDVATTSVDPSWVLRDDAPWKVRGGNSYNRRKQLGKTVVKRGEYHKPSEAARSLEFTISQIDNWFPHLVISSLDKAVVPLPVKTVKPDLIKQRANKRKLFLARYQNSKRAEEVWDSSQASSKYTHWQAAVRTMESSTQKVKTDYSYVDHMIKTSSQHADVMKLVMADIENPNSVTSQKMGKKGIRRFKSATTTSLAGLSAPPKLRREGNASSAPMGAYDSIVPVEDKFKDYHTITPATGFFLFMMRELHVPEMKMRTMMTGLINLFSIFRTEEDSTRAQLIVMFAGSDLFLFICGLINENINQHEKCSTEWLLNLFETVGGMVSGKPATKTRTTDKTKFRNEGKASVLLNRIKFSPLVVKTMYIFSHVVGLASFAEIAKVESFTAASAVKILDLASTETNTMIMLVELIEYWEERVEAFKITKDWREFFQLSQVDGMVEKLAAFKLRIEKMTTDLEPEDYRLVNTEGQALLIRCLHIKHPMVTNMAFTLRDELFTMVKRSKRKRQMPHGYIIGGEPGVGKTHMLEMLCDHLKCRRKIPMSASVDHVYQETDHQQLPLVVKVVVFNDIFQIKDDCAKVPVMQLLQSLCDTTPFSFQAASIADKDTSSVAPEFVIGTTNAHSYFMSTAIGGANKLNRRYKVIWVDYSPATLANYTEDELKQNPYVEGGMIYGVYDMDSGKGQTVTVKPKPDAVPIYVTDNVTDLVYWIMDRRDEFVALERIAVEKCECGVLKGTNHKCYLDRVAEQPLVNAEEIAEVAAVATNATPSRWPFMNWRNNEEYPEIEAFETSMLELEGNINVTHRVESNQCNYMAGVVRNFTDEYRSLKKGAKIGMLGMGALGLVLLVLKTTVKGYNYYYPITIANEGACVTKLNCDLGEAPFVRKFTNVNVAWAQRSTHVAIMEIWSGSYSMHALLITQKMVAIPKHFIIDGKVHEGSELVFKYHGIVQTRKFQLAHWYAMPGVKDVGFLYVGGMPSLTHPVFNNLDAEVHRERMQGTLGDTPLEAIQFDGRRYLYEAKSQPGDCGLPLVSSTGVVLGFHVGVYEHNDARAAEPITRNMALEAMEAFEKRGLISDIFSDKVPDIVKIVLQGSSGMHPSSDAAWYDQKQQSVLYSGLTPLGFTNVKNKSRMTCRRTTMYEHFGGEIDTHGKPYVGKAKPIDGDWVSPVVYFLRNTSHTGNVDHNLAMAAIDQFLGEIPDGTIGPLSWTETIVGHPDNVFINARDNSKAVGFSMGARGISKNLAFVQEEDGAWTIHPTLVREMRRLEYEMEFEDIPLSVAEANFKDEAYPMEKVAQNKARIFFVNDIAQNLLMRKYLLPILAYLMEFPLETGLIVAMNAASYEWGLQASYLNEFGDVTNKIAGDQKSLDQRQNEMLSYYAVCMEKLSAKLGYSKRDQRMVRRIILSAGRSILVMMGNFFLLDRMLLSGRPDTIHANCITCKLVIYMAVAMELLQVGLVIPTATEQTWRIWAKSTFAALIACLFTGDDHTLAIAREFGLTGKKIQDMAAECGYEITRADKSSGEIVFQKLEDVTYLQRGYVQREGTYYGPLKEESIYKSLKYVVGVKPAEEESRNRNACLCASREWFLHGQERFEKELEILQKIHPDLKFPTYKQLDLEYKHRVFQTWAPTVELKTDLGIVEEPATMSSTIRHEGRLASPKRSNVQVKAPSGCELEKFKSHIDWRGSYLNNAVANTELSLNTSEVTTNDLTSTPVVLLGTNELVTSDHSQTGKKPMRKEPEGTELAQFFSRPRKIKTFNVGTLQNGEVFGLWKNNTYVTTVLDHWGLFRGNAVITFAVTGGSNFMGMTRICAAPNRDIAGVYNQATWDFGTQVNTTATVYTSQLPHVDIDLSLVGTYELKLAYPHAYPYMDIVENDWTLYSVPVNPVQMANGATPAALEIQVWVHYEDVHLSKIIPQGREAPPAQLSNMLSYASMVTSMIPYPIALPASELLGAGAAMAKFFGYSKPNIAPQDVVMVHGQGNLSAASGEPSPAYNFALDASVTTDISGGNIPLHEDEDTTFQSLIHRKAQVVKNWTTGTALQMTPAAMQIVTAQYHLTPLGFAASMFRYWTGSLKVCVEVISSPLVRWRIGVMIVPPGFPTPVIFDGNAAYLTTTIEVVGSTCAEIEVPYLHTKPFMNVITPDIMGVDISQTRIVWFPLMASTGPAATPIVPEVNVWLEAGEDFSCGIPDMTLMNNYCLTTQGKANGEQAIAQFGEVIEDLRLLTHRSVLSCAARNPASNALIIPLMPWQPNQLASSLFIPGLDVEYRAWTFGSYLSLPYLGASGSYSYAVYSSTTAGGYMITEIESEPGAVLPTSKAGTFPDSSSRGILPVNSNVNTYGQIMVPNREFADFHYPIGYHVDDEWIETVAVTAISGIVAGNLFRFYSATGDDYVLGGFLAVPGLQISPQIA